MPHHTPTWRKSLFSNKGQFQVFAMNYMNLSLQMYTTTCASGIGEAMPECAIRLRVWECCIGCIQCRDLGNPVWCNLAPKGSRLRFITPRAFGGLAAALASRGLGSGARNLYLDVQGGRLVLGYFIST